MHALLGFRISIVIAQKIRFSIIFITITCIGDYYRCHNL